MVRSRPAPAHPVAVPATHLECHACGYRPPADAPIALACPQTRSGDDLDHLLVRRLDPSVADYPRGGEANPFLRYRTLSHAYHTARAAGWDDAAYVALVERLDAAVARVEGRGFMVTPFVRNAALSERLGFTGKGGVWVKDETGNVSGSHKARHLMGTLVALEVAEAARRTGQSGVSGATSGGASGVTGTTDANPTPALPPLAIASCGNAALAAAVVARAADRPLDVFVPGHADAAVVARLRDLGARLTVCEREPGAHGDPTYHRLLRAIEGGAVPFTCQGNLNGLAIEGGMTLGWEIVDELSRTRGRLDRIVVQVGGGALASAVAQAFEEAAALGTLDRLPRLDTVQTAGAHPLARAHERLAVRLHGGMTPSEALSYAARHRSEFMWPWETEPRSIATGILDDETYDWLAVVGGMLATGGSPVIVEETTLANAHALAREATGIDVDPTGSSGLAGLLALLRSGDVRPDESVAVLFTGVTRRPDQPPRTEGGNDDGR